MINYWYWGFSSSVRVTPGLFFLFLSLSFWLCPTSCGILVPQPGIEPAAPALEAWSLFFFWKHGVLITRQPEKSKDQHFQSLFWAGVVEGTKYGRYFSLLLPNMSDFEFKFTPNNGQWSFEEIQRMSQTLFAWWEGSSHSEQQSSSRNSPSIWFMSFRWW